MSVSYPRPHSSLPSPLRTGPSSAPVSASLSAPAVADSGAQQSGAQDAEVSVLVAVDALVALEDDLHTEHERLSKLGRQLLQHGPEVQRLAKVAFALSAHVNRLRQRIAELRS